MAGRAAAGPPIGFHAGRLSTFRPLTEAEIEAFAAAIGLTVAELGQRGLADGRSAVRAIEMLVDTDVERRIANATAPTARHVAVGLAERGERIKDMAEELLLAVSDLGQGIGSASSAEAEVARRLLLAGLPQATEMLLRVAMAAASQALELSGQTGPGQWSPNARDDAALGDLAGLLADLGFPTDIAQDDALDGGGGTYFDVAVVFGHAVLHRLTMAATDDVAGAGMAADRLRQFLQMKPVTIGRRLRRARERVLVVDLAASGDAFNV